MAQNRHLAALDSEYVAALATFPAAPSALPDIAVARRESKARAEKTMVQMEPFLPPASAYRVEEHHVPVDGGQITVRCLIPTPGRREGLTFPVLVWYHGGGYVMGGLEQDDYNLRMYCVAQQICIVNVDYRLAPEHVFPTSLNDSYAATKWIAENAHVLAVSLSKGFIVAGSSAGANLATVVAHRAISDPFFTDKPVTGQLLCVPNLLHPKNVPEQYKSELLSFEEITDTVLPTAEIFRNFEATQAPTDDPEFAPLLYASQTGLPPAVLQVCGLDPLRDEALLYEKLMRQDGVKTKLLIYPGLPHAFALFFPQISAAGKYKEDTGEGIRWLLSQGAGAA